MSWYQIPEPTIPENRRIELCIFFALNISTTLHSKFEDTRIKTILLQMVVYFPHDVWLLHVHDSSRDGSCPRPDSWQVTKWRQQNTIREDLCHLAVNSSWVARSFLPPWPFVCDKDSTITFFCFYRSCTPSVLQDSNELPKWSTSEYLDLVLFDERLWGQSKKSMVSSTAARG